MRLSVISCLTYIQVSLNFPCIPPERLFLHNMRNLDFIQYPYFTEGEVEAAQEGLIGTLMNLKDIHLELPESVNKLPYMVNQMTQM